MRHERVNHVRDKHVTSLATGAGRFITSVTAEETATDASAVARVPERVGGDDSIGTSEHSCDALACAADRAAEAFEKSTRHRTP